MNCHIGIDFGTSGCRAVAIDDNGSVIAETRLPLPAPEQSDAGILQDPILWWNACIHLLDALFAQLKGKKIIAICVNGTSGTVLVTDKFGTPLAPARMYNDASCVTEADRIRQHAPAASGAHGSSSGLAKALRLYDEQPKTHWFHTQADWIAGNLRGQFGVSDENNALKLGYDPITRTWPTWLNALDVPSACFPSVVPPGTALGHLSPQWTKHWKPATSPMIVAGTTDSIAAFIAAASGIGPLAEGIAVTSLGSTLVLKIAASQPLFAPEFGIYSHRLQGQWLTGGASNSGGAVLLQHFSPARIDELSKQLQPDISTRLNYYPLPRRGERFPINDPQYAPRISPRPSDDVVFFQALLEGMAEIERRGYSLLADLGASYPKHVLSAGGGAKNASWLKIRERVLGVPVTRATIDEAAYGSALLARGVSSV